MEGQIIKIVSDLHYVDFNNHVYPCKCRGIFRKKNIIPLVGDYVVFDQEKLIIQEVKERKNEFKRPKVSNIDQAFIVTSLKAPAFSFNLLDKLISLMELSHVEPIICITKEDLLSKLELDKIWNILDYYQKIGYKVISNTDIQVIKKLVKGKTSVFTGQTGAGKSTLLNKLNPNWNLDVGEVSLSLGRGKHTTRVVSMYDLCGGKVVDTPGFSALEFSHFSKAEIRDSFIEFKKIPCPFKDCMHTKEKECIVKQKVFDNNILESRYLNYLNFIGEDVK